MEGDVDVMPYNAGHYLVSIHAPAWRATKDLEATSDGMLVSIHAPAWRATLVLMMVLQI